jgi:hypothetical protein
MQNFLRSDGSSIVFSGTQTPRTLGSLLEGFPWDVAQRGPLLVVAPNTVVLRPTSPKAPLTELLASAERQQVRVGRLSAFVPLNIQTLAPHEESTDETVTEAWLGLMETLSESQWQKLLGTQGLGFADVSVLQARKLERIIPQTVTVITRQRDADGRIIDSRNTTLSDVQRQQVRIRLNRELAWSYFAMDEKLGTYGVNLQRSRSPHELQRQESSQASGNHSVVRVPNALKRSELDFRNKAFDPTISLSNVKTLGELVARAAEASRIELHTDRRYARLSVQCWGETARVGDVLEALAYSVGGAFRRVSDGKSTLYILTSDLEGLESHRVRRAVWSRRKEMLGQEKELSQLQKILKKNPRQWLTFSEDDPYALSLELTRRLDGQRKRATDQVVPSAELTPAIREAMRDQLKKLPQYTPLSDQKVSLRTSVKVSLIVPGFGTLPDPEFALQFSLNDAVLSAPGDFNTPEPPAHKRPLAQILATWPIKIALCAPRTPEEAIALAQKASEVKLSGLWLEVPGDPERALPILRAAIATKKIPISAVVRPCHPRLASALPGLTPDRTVLLETEPEWMKRFQGMEGPTFYNLTTPYLSGRVMVVPDQAAREYFGRQLAAIAQTPGLVGLTLTDYLPPGYTGNFGVSMGMGYLPQNRITFIRQEKIDPLDLPDASSWRLNGEYDSPSYFWDVTLQTQRPRTEDDPPAPDEGIRTNRMIRNKDSPVIHWQEVRQKEGLAAVSHWQTAIQKAAPQLSLWISQAPSNFGSFFRWDDTTVLSKTWTGEGRIAEWARLQKGSLSLIVPRPWLGLPFWPQNIEEAARIETLTKRQASGCVFNLAQQSTEEALWYLAALTSR